MAKKHRYKSMHSDYKETLHTRHCRMRRRKVARLSEAQGHRCCYCSGETFLIQPWESLPKGMSWDQRATLEHLVPQCEPVQTNKDENLVMACAICNTLRGLEDPIKFYTRLKSYIKPQIIEKKEQEITEKKLGKTLALCLIAARCWPKEAAFIAENWKPAKKKVKANQRRARKINKIAFLVRSDPRRLAA